MRKNGNHDEHVNHERWLVSFADMMTLLFALFVVLYALGQADLTKLKKLKESVQFAFHIAGEGKTKEEGVFDKQKGGGEALQPVPLINAQDGAMKEFLQDTLPKEFEEVTGKSLDIVQTNDTLSFRAPLAAFFEPNHALPIKRDVYNWLVKAAQGALTFTSQIRVRIEAPDVIVGERDGRKVTSLELCDRRLWTLRKAILGLPQVQPWMVDIELNQQRDAAPGSARADVDWEQRGQVIFAFSNQRAENR